MEYVVIFTFQNEKYAVQIMASTKEEALLKAATNMIKDYRHFDSVEVVNML